MKLGTNRVRIGLCKQLLRTCAVHSCRNCINCINCIVLLPSPPTAYWWHQYIAGRSTLSTRVGSRALRFYGTSCINALQRIRVAHAGYNRSHGGASKPQSSANVVHFSRVQQLIAPALYTPWYCTPAVTVPVNNQSLEKIQLPVIGASSESLNFSKHVNKWRSYWRQHLMIMHNII